MEISDVAFRDWSLRRHPDLIQASFSGLAHIKSIPSSIHEM